MTIEINRNTEYTYRISPTDPLLIERQVAKMAETWYTTGVNHAKSDGALERRRHPFSTCDRGARTMSDHTRVPHFPPNLEDYAPWVSTHGLVAPYGECQCGCGLAAPLASYGSTTRGYKRHAPGRFISGHINGAKQTLADAFWQYVTRGTDEECWLWQGNFRGRGYGSLRHAGSGPMVAHRVSYELHYGPIPRGMIICHKCDNPSCVNPCHLFVGTDKDNVDDMMAKGRNGQPKGEFHPRAKLTRADVDAILSLRGSGQYQREIGKRYGVSAGTISSIWTGRTWGRVK